MPDATVRLCPATAEVVVRDPITREPLPADGADKPLDTYWSRRLVDGDVLVLPAAAEAPASRSQSRLKAVPPPPASDAT